MPKFFISNENKIKVNELLKALSTHEIFLFSMPPYIQTDHLTLLLDIQKAVEEAGSPELEASTTEDHEEAKHFSEKKLRKLDELISLLIANENTAKVVFENQQMLIDDALKRLRSMLYKNDIFTFITLDSPKEYLIYATIKGQLIFRFTKAHRKEILEKLGMLKQSHSDLKEIYPDDDECFYIPYFRMRYSERGIHFGSAQSCNDFFNTLLGFTPEPQTVLDKAINRTGYAKGFIYRYKDSPECLYFDPNAKIFLNHRYYLRVLHGEIKIEKRVQLDDFFKCECCNKGYKKEYILHRHQEKVHAFEIPIKKSEDVVNGSNIFIEGYSGRENTVITVFNKFDLIFKKHLDRSNNSTIDLCQLGNKTVAVKTYHERTLERILNEVKTMAIASRDESDYIVRLMGIVVAPGCSLVMEYVPYGNLNKLLFEKQELTWAKCYQIALGTTKGLAHLHQLNILHRDIKSHNLLLGNSCIKLGDFGCALDLEDTKGHELYEFTEGWHPPEFEEEKKGIKVCSMLHEKYKVTLWRTPKVVVKGKRSTKASDIFSLGAVFFELLTALLPTYWASEQRSPLRIINWLKFASTLNIFKAAPKEFLDITLSCLDENPNLRPTAANLSEKLDRLWWIENEKPSSSIICFFSSPPEYMSPEYVDELLRLVAEGDQDQAETVIKKNKNLLLYKGTVKDLSGQEFKEITAFQYALWAMDWHMWAMIQKYLPPDQTRKQFEQLGRQHGCRFNLKGLLDALENYVEHVKNYGYDQKASDLWKRVGDEQKLLPVHVVNEYCRPDRGFFPCPDEWESKLPRTQKVPSLWDVRKPKVPVPKSFYEGLEFNYGYFRSNYSEPRNGWIVPANLAAQDLNALKSLWEHRDRQFGKYIYIMQKSDKFEVYNDSITFTDDSWQP